MNYKRIRFNKEDAEFIKKNEFKFQRANKYLYCYMGEFTSRLENAPLTEEVKNELIWANIKCYLENKYGKNYYRQYTVVDL